MPSRIRDQEFGCCVAYSVCIVNCEKIHSGRLQTIATYEASNEQLIMERMIEKLKQLS